MVKYDIKIPRDRHWDSLWEEIRLQGPITYPYDIDLYLKRYNGRTYLDDEFLALKVIKGIEFKTEEDLTFFKLKFN